MVIEGSRFSEWSPTDHQAPLWVVNILSPIYSLLFLCVRLIVKYKAWGLDDLVLGMAYVRNPLNYLLDKIIG